MPQFCPNCGEKISESIKFCPECGAIIDSFNPKSDKNGKSDKDIKDSVKYWYNQGVDFSESKEYKKALGAYNQAITFDDKDPDIWNNKCFVLIKLGRYEEAIKAGNIGVELAPNDPQIWDCLRDAYIATNNPEKAAQCSIKISDIENSFSPIEKTDYKIAYQKCIGKTVYYFNIIAIWLIIGISVLLSFSNGQTPQRVGMELGSQFISWIVIAVAWYWIAPSGIRRVYNKSHGSRTASNIACLLCVWFSLIGWVICWAYENW